MLLFFDKLVRPSEGLMKPLTTQLDDDKRRALESIAKETGSRKRRGSMAVIASAETYSSGFIAEKKTSSVRSSSIVWKRCLAWALTKRTEPGVQGMSSPSTSSVPLPLST